MAWGVMQAAVVACLAPFLFSEPFVFTVEYLIITIMQTYRKKLSIKTGCQLYSIFICILYFIILLPSSSNRKYEQLTID